MRPNGKKQREETMAANILGEIARQIAVELDISVVELEQFRSMPYQQVLPLMACSICPEMCWNGWKIAIAKVIIRNW
jgi:hypothetical protein